MKRLNWLTLFAISLVIASAVLYIIHYVIFKDAHHIFIYLLGDIAFVPIEVLLVTLIIHKLLGDREKTEKLEKLNMVIGTFYSEMGTTLLAYFSDCDPKLDDIRKDLIVTNNWGKKEFTEVGKRLNNYDYGVDIKMVEMDKLRDFLVGKRDFSLRLLENPVLLEHETFTELLRAAFHLTEELASRDDLKTLPDSDYEHLAGDIKRAYTLLVSDWLEYMRYLKDNYPYLFSLAMRTNPFDRDAGPIVK